MNQKDERSLSRRSFLKGLSTSTFVATATPVTAFAAGIGTFNAEPAAVAVPPAPFGALPSARQLAWHEMEMYNMIEFGPITYLEEKDWGWGNESPSMVNPVDFDAGAVVERAKKAGFKGFLVQAKHHGGFCMWPTKTTPYNISKSPWRNGNGDWIGEWATACREHGLKFGIYCSPWDRSTDKFGTPEYLEMYKQQLRELMTNYGELFNVWFDGAPGNGGDGYYGGKSGYRAFSEGGYYPWKELYALVRELQLNAVIFHDPGPDLRWVGNEKGYAPETSWSTFGDPAHPWDGLPGEIAEIEHGRGDRFGSYWIPPECDASLRARFTYHASDNPTVKSPAKLFDMYVNSAGRGCCLDLDIPLNRRGTMDEPDQQALDGFGELLRQTFAHDFAHGAKLVASNIRGGDTAHFGPDHLLDGDRYSYWATDDELTSPECTVELIQESTFNIIRLRENIKLGQRLDCIFIDAWDDGTWKEIATATSIGACRIIRLPSYLTARKLRLRLEAPVSPALSEFALFAEPQGSEAPIIIRSKDGLVTLAVERPAFQIRYTTDGSDPSMKSPLYSERFLYEGQGIVRAAVFDSAGKRGDIGSRQFDLDKRLWRILDSSSEAHTDQASQAIDDDDVTLWETADPVPLPQWIAVDMGRTEEITAFTYQPRKDKSTGVVDHYEYEVSLDGKTWTQVAQGEFDNIRNSPGRRVVTLQKPLPCRYFKFIATHVLEGRVVTVAELGARRN